MRQISHVLYIAVDSLVPARGKSIPGFDEFTAALDHAGVPAVWLTSRSRLQFDEPRRRLGNRHPFIAEDGSAVYLPEDYFHLCPESSGARFGKSATVRLGRFTCIPVADPLPVAADGLEALSEDTGVPIVTLGSLSPRELMQNTGLSHREAELARQRDFDEVFFFAGVSEVQVQLFLAEGRKRKLELRQHGVLWSAAVGASVQRCVRELSRLYDRALHHHAYSVGVATEDVAEDFLAHCDRSILLADHAQGKSNRTWGKHRRVQEVPLRSEDTWERVLELVNP